MPCSRRRRARSCSTAGSSRRRHCSDERANHEFRRRVGFVFQNPEVQLFNPTVRDEIAFGPLQLGWPAERIRDEVERMVDRMQLRAVVERPTFRLSMGEKKRVAIASVLILDPEVILLDEPTAGLDPRSQSGVIDLLERVAGDARARWWSRRTTSG